MDPNIFRFGKVKTRSLFIEILSYAVPHARKCLKISFKTCKKYRELTLTRYREYYLRGVPEMVKTYDLDYEQSIKQLFSNSLLKYQVHIFVRKSVVFLG